MVMRVRTETMVSKPVEDVWSDLCGSRMRLTPRCPVFYVGAPRPVECRLPEGRGGLGAPRQCVSAQGTIEQRITEWTPSTRLAFRMEGTDLPFRRCVRELSDTFELVESRAAGGGRATTLVRTTHVQVSGRMRCVKLASVYMGLKAVHRFVFRDWRVAAGVE